ncbi:hypothetical protein [Sphingobium chungangianum]
MGISILPLLFAQARTHLSAASQEQTALSWLPLPPFGLSLSKPFTLLKKSEALRHLSETGGSLKQGERRRANLDTMTLQTKVIIL